jgi:hypothetical protein
MPNLTPSTCSSRHRPPRFPGIVAKLAYLQDIAERDAWMFDDRKGCATRLIEGFAATIANISAVLS